MPTLNDTTNKKDAGDDLIENGPREYRDRQGLSSSLRFRFEIDHRFFDFWITPTNDQIRFLSLSY